MNHNDHLFKNRIVDITWFTDAIDSFPWKTYTLLSWSVSLIIYFSILLNITAIIRQKPLDNEQGI
jgi:hypothetical protein